MKWSLEVDPLLQCTPFYIDGALISAICAFLAVLEDVFRARLLLEHFPLYPLMGVSLSHGLEVTVPNENDTFATSNSSIASF